MEAGTLMSRTIRSPGGKGKLGSGAGRTDGPRGEDDGAGVETEGEKSFPETTPTRIGISGGRNANANAGEASKPSADRARRRTTKMGKGGRTVVTGKKRSCEAQQPRCHSITGGGKYCAFRRKPTASKALEGNCRRKQNFGCRIVRRSSQQQCRE